MKLCSTCNPRSPTDTTDHEIRFCSRSSSSEDETEKRQLLVGDRDLLCDRLRGGTSCTLPSSCTHFSIGQLIDCLKHAETLSIHDISSSGTSLNPSLVRRIEGRRRRAVKGVV